MRFSRAIATGGRRFTDYQRIEDDLRALRRHGLSRLAEGASPGGGADDHAYDAWHLLTNMPTERYPIDNRTDGNTSGAPLVRNVRMVRSEHRLAIDTGEVMLGLAYPDPLSRGTWHCVSEMLRLGVPVVVWAPHALHEWTGPGVVDCLWRCVRDGLARYGVRDPLVFDWGTPRGVVAPLDADEYEFVTLALQVREDLGE